MPLSGQWWGLAFWEYLRDLMWPKSTQSWLLLFLMLLCLVLPRRLAARDSFYEVSSSQADRIWCTFGGDPLRSTSLSYPGGWCIHPLYVPSLMVPIVFLVIIISWDLASFWWAGEGLYSTPPPRSSPLVHSMGCTSWTMTLEEDPLVKNNSLCSPLFQACLSSSYRSHSQPAITASCGILACPLPSWTQQLSSSASPLSLLASWKNYQWRVWLSRL